jgi:hypothetical protein
VQTKLDDYFSNIGKSLITTGVLMDKSAGITAPNNFNGTAECSIASTNDWYTLYKRIHGARTSTSFAVPTDAALFNSIYTQNAEDRIPLGIVFANYHKIKDGAQATEAWFTVSNNKLQDVAGRTQNPYEQKMLLVAAPLRKSVPDGSATFIVPSNLIVNNTGTFTKVRYITF